MIAIAGRISTIISAALIIFAAAVSANAAVEFYTVQDAIEQQGLKWTADDSLFSLLSSDEREGYAGLSQPSAEEQALSDLWLPEVNNALPSAFDWRNVDSASWIGPVQDQMGESISYALAGVQNLEDLLRIRENDPELNLNLTAYPLLPEDASDGSYAAFQNVLVRFGAPVDASNVNENYTADSWQWVTLDEPDVEAVKQAVLRGPVLTLMNVYEDFLFYKSGVYQSLGMGFLGAHVVRIVGWNDADQAWIVQNSWGEDWGEDGFARIYWDDTLSRIGQFTVIQHVDSISESARTGSGGTEQASTTSDPTNASTKRIYSLANTATVSPIFTSQDETPLTLESTVVTLAWDACANTDWYRLEVNTSSSWDEGCRVFYGNIGSDPSKVMDQLETGVVYYWRVWAGNDAGESDPAVGPSFTLQSAGPNYDINNDGYIDVTDIMIVASNWDKTSNDAGFNSAADLNKDNVVDIVDIMMIVAQWRQSA
jgi:hypothetical protein